jgi:hypothetical protein
MPEKTWEDIKLCTHVRTKIYTGKYMGYQHEVIDLSCISERHIKLNRTS